MITGELISLAACRIALMVEVDVQLKAAKIKLINIVAITLCSLTWQSHAVLPAVSQQLEQIVSRHHTGWN